MRWFVETWEWFARTLLDFIQSNPIVILATIVAGGYLWWLQVSHLRSQLKQPRVCLELGGVRIPAPGTSIRLGFHLWNEGQISAVNVRLHPLGSPHYAANFPTPDQVSPGQERRQIVVDTENIDAASCHDLDAFLRDFPEGSGGWIEPQTITVSYRDFGGNEYETEYVLRYKPSSGEGDLNFVKLRRFGMFKMLMRRAGLL